MRLGKQRPTTINKERYVFRVGKLLLEIFKTGNVSPIVFNFLD